MGLGRIHGLVAGQVISLVASLLFPIAFVSKYGHEAFGNIALTVSYAGFFLSLTAGAIGQSVLERGLDLRQLSWLVCLLVCGAGFLWTISLGASEHPAVAAVILAVAILLVQTAMHVVYYVMVKLEMSVGYLLFFGIETLVRLAVLELIDVHAGHSLPLAGVYYLISASVAATTGLALVWRKANCINEFRGVGLSTATVVRFVKWAISGAVLASFDRTLFASHLEGEQLSVFLFYSSLFTVGFSIIANAVTMEVIATDSNQFVTSRQALVILLAFGLCAGTGGTALVFVLHKTVGVVTGFDPAVAVVPVMIGFGYRACLYVQQLCFGYLERRGGTARVSNQRLFTSAALILWFLISGGLPLTLMGTVCVGVMLAAAALCLASVEGRWVGAEQNFTTDRNRSRWQVPAEQPQPALQRQRPYADLK